MSERPDVPSSCFPEKRKQRTGLLVAVIALLVIGTTIPGSFKSSIEAHLWSAWPWDKSAHFGLFALLAAIPAYGGGKWWPARAIALAIFLAAVTETLQRFVPGRHPMVRDVFIDLAGTLTGLLFVAARGRW